MLWLIAIAVETLILLAHDGSAQQLKRKFPLNALYIEFLGSGLVLTANYDYRLDDQSGLRIGAGMIPLFEHGSATIFVIVGQSYLLFPLGGELDRNWWRYRYRKYSKYPIQRIARFLCTFSCGISLSTYHQWFDIPSRINAAYRNCCSGSSRGESVHTESRASRDYTVGRAILRLVMVDKGEVSACSLPRSGIA